jgi:hypothetical protein
LGSLLRRNVGRHSKEGLTSTPVRTQRRFPIDHLASLQLGPAGWRHGSTVQVDQTSEGTVASGSLGWLHSGRYRATVELWPGPRQGGLTDHDQALVVEIATGGYVLGARAATFGEIEEDSVHIEFTLPQRLLSESLTAGTEVRIRARRHVAGTLGAVLLERIGEEEAECPSRFEWLSTMDAGEAGRRAGVEVNTMRDRHGLVVSGPHWRLPAGSYRTRLRTRLVGHATGEGLTGVSAAEAVAVVDVVEGETVLAEAQLSRQEVFDGLTVLPFVLSNAHAVPGARIGVRFRTEIEVSAVIESVEVELVGLLED